MPSAHAVCHAPAWGSTPSTTHATASPNIWHATRPHASWTSVTGASPRWTARIHLPHRGQSRPPPPGHRHRARRSGVTCAHRRGDRQGGARRLRPQRGWQRVLAAARIHIARRPDLPQQGARRTHAHRHLNLTNIPTFRACPMLAPALAAHAPQSVCRAWNPRISCIRRWPEHR